ncbi:TRAP transporter permease [Alkalicoccobacillus porphyridii]|uniref:TRAP transporter permease n=1 Tax=Alkalicoccobacillus porphyridii TaxID=2597270 RepID=A0A554A1F5_9BACI|nr:TRAP transporter permease [Alkalicoccobacillus porphyridii]TSB47476.1 TRAP transporter permease [Alkalicoccobacillus porphyridii]
MKKDDKLVEPTAIADTEIPDKEVQKVLEKYDIESNTRNWSNRGLVLFFSLLTIGYALFHLYITFYPLPTLLQRSFHLTFGMALVFLLYPTYKKQDRTKIPFYDWILFALSIGSCIYLFNVYQEIVTTRGGVASTTDILMAILTVILVFEAARRVTGWILPILAFLFLLYPFFSHQDWLPRMLLTRPFDFADIFGQMYTKTEGLFSTAIGASVQFIFLFILFGAFLAKSGMGKFFNDLALALAGHKQGGPAKVAVLSSAMMGSVNGSAVGNVVSTGAFTIPLMKKIGYDKNFSGAVEASSSIGGQILPPIMGASAFIMAETTGISYGTIALAAIIPAFLFFITSIMQVHYRAGRSNLRGLPKADLPEVKKVMKQGWHLMIPLISLIIMLFSGVPVSYAAFYTILVSVAASWIRKHTRMYPKDILKALETGTRQALSTIIACGVVGIVIGVVNLTGFGATLTSAITSLGQGSLLLTLILTMLASLVLGMGLPSIPAYIITATMAAPALATFDVPILVAHLFVFYFGIFANITPPVALASFAASGLAGGDPMRTSIISLRLSVAGFLVPFVFVYNHSMLLIDATGLPANTTEFAFASIPDIAFVLITSTIAVIAISAAVEGYIRTNLGVINRLVLGAASVLAIVPEMVSSIIGIAVIIVIYVLNYMKAKKDQDPPVGVASSQA